MSVKIETLLSDKIEALKQISVSRETLLAFELYAELLHKWQNVKNLVAPSTLPHLWSRHILDSYQLYAHLSGATKVLDLGSGGGLPGIILGIMLKNQGEVHLVESNQKKCAFLREAARVTGASCVIHAKRVEDVIPDFVGKVEIVTARAFTSLAELLTLTKPLLTTGTRGLFLKGASVQDEITEARKQFEFTPELIPSLTSDLSVILRITNIE
jgi:16S rRNA (guanine527-N7)-methyltransferase